MIAIAYTLLFCFLGAQMIRWLMPRKSPLVRAWLGVSLGVLMEMGLPALCANALDFTVAAHIAAVAAALLLTAPSSSQPEVPILLRFPAPAECTVLLPWLLAALLALLSWTGFRSGMRPLTAAAPALFAGLFFVGNSFLFLGLLGAILLRALAEWFLQWKRCAHRCRTP